MSNQVLRIVIAGAFILHGIGHSMGIIPALGFELSEGWTARSWLLTDLIGDRVARVVGIVIWAAALICFVGAGLGLLGWLVPQESWRTLAVIGAVISVVGLALFWSGFVTLFNKIAALAVDLATLVALLIANWPPESIVE